MPNLLLPRILGTCVNKNRTTLPPCTYHPPAETKMFTKFCEKEKNQYKYTGGYDDYENRQFQQGNSGGGGGGRGGVWDDPPPYQGRGGGGGGYVLKLCRNTCEILEKYLRNT